MKIFNAYSISIAGGLLLASCASNQPFANHNPKAELVSEGYAFTEGPASDSKGNVYFTDQPNNKIFKWDWQTNKVSMFTDQSGRANGTYFDDKDNLLTCSDDHGEIWQFSEDGQKKVVLHDYQGKRLNGPNDLWWHNGDVYFTDPLYTRDYWKDFKQEIFKEKVYLRKANGEVSIQDSLINKPNGIVGISKKNIVYVADIGAGKTYQYKIAKDGSLQDKKLFTEMGSDGLTVDNHGNVYLTGKGVTVFNKKGEKIDHIDIAQDWTSNVTFGGKDFSTLFITAFKGVYVVPTKVKGVR